MPRSTEMLTSTPPHLLLASNAKWELGGLRLLTFCLEVLLQSFPGRRSICPERSLCPAHVENQSQPRARLVRSGFEWIVAFCSLLFFLFPFLWVPLAVLVLRWGDGSPTCSLSHRDRRHETTQLFGSAPQTATTPLSVYCSCRCIAFVCSGAPRRRGRLHQLPKQTAFVCFRTFLRRRMRSKIRTSLSYF